MKLKVLFLFLPSCCISIVLYSFLLTFWSITLLHLVLLLAAIPGRVHDVLLKHFDCKMECFASPLNCRYQNFCSAFDLDRCFGNVGNFFSTRFRQGCYQANPPFCEKVIGSMCNRMNELLKESSE